MTKKKCGAVNERERRFVVEFLGKARGNATLAARRAGYSAKSARQQASRLLTKAAIQRALVARVAKADAASIADADERDTILSSFARSGVEDTRDRIIAIAELNKCSGRHSIKHLVKGTLTLEQILTQSREPTP